MCVFWGGSYPPCPVPLLTVLLWDSRTLSHAEWSVATRSLTTAREARQRQMTRADCHTACVDSAHASAIFLTHSPARKCNLGYQRSSLLSRADGNGRAVGWGSKRRARLLTDDVSPAEQSGLRSACQKSVVKRNEFGYTRE